jgi:hypothetical protein
MVELQHVTHRHTWRTRKTLALHLYGPVLATLKGSEPKRFAREMYYIVGIRRVMLFNPVL